MRKKNGAIKINGGINTNFLKPPMKITKDNFLPKEETAFIVNGTIFKTKETAQKYIDFLNQYKDEILIKKYDWNIGYSYEWVEQTNEYYKINENNFYKKETIYANIERIKNFENENKLIQKEQENFDKYSKSYNLVMEGIWQEIWRIRELQSKVDKYKEIFKEYLSLCDNDKEKAKVFFFKAHTLNEQELNLMGDL